MPAAEKGFHIVTEALSVCIAAPFLMYVGLTHQMVIVGLACIAMAIMLVVIDGYLLLKYDEWAEPLPMTPASQCGAMSRQDGVTN